MSPGLITLIDDLEVHDSLPLTTIRPNDTLEPDVTCSLNFFFFGSPPFTSTLASPLKFVPFIVRLSFPAAARSQ
jgi:hypothetical protein